MHSLRQASREDIAAIHEVRMSVRENQLTRSGAISERDYIDHLETLGHGWVIEAGDRVVAVVIGNARNGNIWGSSSIRNFSDVGSAGACSIPRSTGYGRRR
jgi:hypothetical protein